MKAIDCFVMGSYFLILRIQDLGINDT